MVGFFMVASLADWLMDAFDELVGCYCIDLFVSTQLLFKWKFDNDLPMLVQNTFEQFLGIQDSAALVTYYTYLRKWEISHPLWASESRLGMYKWMVQCTDFYEICGPVGRHLDIARNRHSEGTLLGTFFHFIIKKSVKE